MTICCRDFDRARQRGTDNECYGSLIYTYDYGLDFFMGCGLSPISHCPWCGKEVGRAVEEKDESMRKSLINILAQEYGYPVNTLDNKSDQELLLLYKWAIFCEAYDVKSDKP